jgi:hypothetical protein
MSTARVFGILALAFLHAGCMHEPRASSSQPQSWSHVLSDEEIARCKQVASDAAESPVMWERFKPRRLSTEPVKLTTTGIQYYLDQKRFDRVEVAIPSGGHFGRHSCFIGVTVARGSYKILGMDESFWP